MTDRHLLFKEFAQECSKRDFYIGQGNPNSMILFVGCEPNDTDEPEQKVKNNRHTFECLNELNGKSYKDLWQIRSKKGEGCTWSKYQKIIDTVYPKRKHIAGKLDFEEMAFCTELNNVCARHSAYAKKDTIGTKLELFKESKFIQSFPVVVLACGSYIVNQGSNRQIDNTFGVSFHKVGLPDSTQNYWIHYDGLDYDKSNKLVIHTRQLSGPINNELLFSIGNTIKSFLELNCDL